MLRDWVAFIFVLLASGGIAAATLIFLMARTLLRPTRMTDGKATWVLKRLSPGDLGLRFEDLRFQIRDEQIGRTMNLAAWWIPSAGVTSSRTILLLHGYADAKVGAIAWAPTLHALGWNILALDLRGHGHSDGTLSTAGYWERHDVAQVINQFRTERPRETESFAIFGVSLGAAVGVATAAMREDIDALLLESPFADYRLAVAAHGRMRGLPGGWMRDAAIRLAEWMAGADFRAVRPRDLLAKLRCPVMVIHAGDDPFIPANDAAAMAEALRSRGNPADALWSVPQAGHVLALAVSGAEEYRQRVATFLDSIATGSQVATPPPAPLASRAD